jgi:hypothetical protein
MTYLRKTGLFVLLLSGFCLPLLTSDNIARAMGPDDAEDGLDNATVLIVRHAEKPAHGRGLSKQGNQRAQAYSEYFAPLTLDEAAYVPDRLIAASNSLVSKRSLLTLQPLAHNLGLPVEQGFAKDRTAELVASIRRHNTAKVILIAWHHGHLDKLVHAFGADSDELAAPWPSSLYNRMIVLHFDAHGTLMSSRSCVVQEHLLSGD